MRLTEDQRRTIADGCAAMIGLPLVDMFRYGCQKFEFGDEDAGTDWGLLACESWRIEGPEGFVLSNEDFEPERRDEFARPFYNRQETAPIVVEGVDVTEDGGLRFAFSDGFTLAVHPDPATAAAEEQWTIMPPRSESRGFLEYAYGRIGWHRTWSTPIAILFPTPEGSPE